MELVLNVKKVFISGAAALFVYFNMMLFVLKKVPIHSLFTFITVFKTLGYKQRIHSLLMKESIRGHYIASE